MWILNKKNVFWAYFIDLNSLNILYILKIKGNQMESHLYPCCYLNILSLGNIWSVVNLHNSFSCFVVLEVHMIYLMLIYSGFCVKITSYLLIDFSKQLTLHNIMKFITNRSTITSIFSFCTIPMHVSINNLWFVVRNMLSVYTSLSSKIFEPLWYNWNIVGSGIKYHKPKPSEIFE